MRIHCPCEFDPARYSKARPPAHRAPPGHTPTLLRQAARVNAATHDRSPACELVAPTVTCWSARPTTPRGQRTVLSPLALPRVNAATWRHHNSERALGPQRCRERPPPANRVRLRAPAHLPNPPGRARQRGNLASNHNVRDLPQAKPNDA